MANNAADIVQKTIRDLEDDLKSHQKQVDRFDRRYRAYRGVIEQRSQAASWTNKQHPAYALQAVETMVASLLDPTPRWRLRACPIMGTPEEIQTLQDGAKANELLLQHQLVVDKYAEKQRPFDLQGLVLGITASKQYWVERRGPKHELSTVDEPVYGAFGSLIGTRPKLVETSREVSYRDDPTSEVVDVRDLILPENATSLQTCPRIVHRMWLTFDDLKQLERDGVYGPDAGGEKVDLLKEGKGFGDESYNREQELFQVKRTKDLIEVCECWVEKGRRVVTVANRKVLLSDKPNPFWFDHLDYQYPFVVCSSMPDLFRIPGISEVELMQELQEMLWTLINQRLDATQLLANPIFMIADDVEDPDAFEFGVGERWLVPRPVEETIKQWAPDPQIPQLTLQAEGLLKTDLQNITGGMPFLGGTDQGIDQKTATGVSIITSLAQKRLATKRQQFVWAKGRVGEQWCALNQQFVRGPKVVPIVGSEGAQAFATIQPEMIKGSYSFQVEMAEESLMRQEKRAEAQAKLQVAISSVGPWAALSQAGVVPMLNLKAFMDDYLDAFDVSDKEKYYTQKTPPPLSQPGQPQGAPGQPGEAGGGVTSPLATGAGVPSNDASMSSQVFQQRMLASTGGPVNGG